MVVSAAGGSEISFRGRAKHRFATVGWLPVDTVVTAGGIHVPSAVEWAIVKQEVLFAIKNDRRSELFRSLQAR